MEDARIDRLEERLDDLASEMRAGFRVVDTRLCRVEARLEQTEARLNVIDKRLEETATKTDLRALEARLELRLAQAATKADLNELRAEMYRMNGEMKNWMIATTLTLVATFLVALFGLQHWNG
jgi:chromosome segregation ATPase